MAYTPCAASLAANIAIDCAKPIVGGYTGRAVIIPLEDSPVITTSSTDPARVITAIAPASGAKVVMVDNVFAAPFTGSTKTSNADSGRVKFTKSLAVQIPLRGAEASKNVIEPLMKSAEGFLLVVEKKDRRGLGSYEVLGFHEAVKADPTSYSRNEDENGGAALITLMCNEDVEEVDLFDTDYATTKAAFEALIAKAY